MPERATETYLPKALTLRYVPAVATLTALPVLWVLRGARPLCVWASTLAG